MGNQNQTCHSGVVKSVGPEMITVSVIAQAACVSCQVKGSCSSADIKEKEVEVFEWEGSFSPGDQVEIIADTTKGYTALFFGYLLPLILMVATLATLMAVTEHEAIAAIGSLLILLPYYFLLFLFRFKLRNKLKFRIRKQLNFNMQ